MKNRTVGADSISAQKGITLIALVITIIVLLILAGITINLTLGEHGILNMAKEAGKNHQNAAEYEQRALGEFFNEAQNIIAGGNGTGTNPGDTVGPWRLADKVNVGDYVAYDPTDGVTDTSQLSYISPVGTGTSHGNGAASQTFTVDNQKRWRVLSKDIDSGEIILISENPISPDGGNYYNVNGAIGYLYLEQELNEISKIYGYGKGADITKTYTYHVGGPLDTPRTGMITSGARSLNVNDVNTLVGFTPPTIGITHDQEAYYPTTQTSTGHSESTTTVITEDKSYYYYADTYLDSEDILSQLLFRDTYLASRMISYNNGWEFGCCGLTGNSLRMLGVSPLAKSYYTSLDDVSLNNSRVSPIIYLKTTLRTSGKDENGAWNIIDE